MDQSYGSRSSRIPSGDHMGRTEIQGFEHDRQADTRDQVTTMENGRIVRRLEAQRDDRSLIPASAQRILTKVRILIFQRFMNL